MTSDGRIALGSRFSAHLAQVLPRLLGQPGALPDDWDHRATTYDLFRFDSDDQFAERFARAIDGIASEDVTDAAAIRARLIACGLPFDYARLGQPLSTVFELAEQARTNAARCFAFASVTKPWLAVIEAPRRTRPVRVFAAGALPLSARKQAELVAAGVALHEHARELPPADPDVLTVWVASERFAGDVQASAADAICYPVHQGGVLLLRDTGRIPPGPIQIIRKRTVAALLAADAQHELARAAGLTPPTLATADAATCQARLTSLFPQITDSLYFCTGLAAEAALFTAAAEVLGPTPVTLFYAQNGYGGTGQLIGDLLPAQTNVHPAPLPVLGTDAAGRPATIVDRIVARLATETGPAVVFLETPTNPELQAHDFPALLAGLRAYADRTGHRVPVLVDTTLAPLYPIFAKDVAKDWPFILVKSGSKYFTKGKATLGVVACASDALARRIVDRARALGQDADAFARPEQLAELATGLADLAPRMATIAAHTTRLADGIRAALGAYGHAITLYAITEPQIRDGLASGLLSFYLPPAPTSHADLVDEFVAHLLEAAPALVKSRVSYGQSTGGGKPDVFYVINPEESTQGALSAAVKHAQKKDNVQICRISVPEHADVPGLLAAMAPFFARKYGPAGAPT